MTRHLLPPGVLHEGDSPKSELLRQIEAAWARYIDGDREALDEASDLLQELRRRYPRVEPQRKRAHVRPGDDGQPRPDRGDFDGKAAAAGPDPD